MNMIVMHTAPECLVLLLNLFPKWHGAECKAIIIMSAVLFLPLEEGVLSDKC